MYSMGENNEGGIVALKEDQDTYISADQWIPIVVKMMESGKRVRIKPHGYSMYPFLRSDQDEVIIGLPTKELKRGDVVLYRRSNGLHVLHRIHHVDHQGYYMVGDSQVTIEGPLQRNQIIGIMEAFIRGNKTTYVTEKWYRFESGIWLIIRHIRHPIINLFHWVRRITKTERKNDEKEQINGQRNKN